MRRQVGWWLALPSLAFGIGIGWPAAAASYLDHWRFVCDDFRRNYSYTAYKGIDWEAMFVAHRGVFESVGSADEFATRLNEALLALHDWHVAVRRPNGAWIGYNAAYPRNYPAQLVTHHAVVPYTNVLSAGALVHARLTDSIVHVILPTLGAEAFDLVDDATLLEHFRSFRSAAGLVLDLRYNAGGSEIHARRIASFHVRTPTDYGTTLWRAADEPGGFLAPTTHRVMPDENLHLDLPVVVLVGQRCLSSCEWLALMFREAPNAILMGDRTRGGTGNPELVTLSELGVSYLRSRWIGRTREGQIIEDQGIAPALYLRADRSYDDSARRDHLLERALEYLRWRQRPGFAGVDVNFASDTDGDGASDVAEFTFGTDPMDATSVPLVRVSPEGLTSNLPVPASREVFVRSADSPVGPWTEVEGTRASGSSVVFPWSVTDRRGFFRIGAELAP